MLNDTIMMALTIALILGLPVALAGLYMLGKVMDKRAAAKLAAAPPPPAKPAPVAKPAAPVAAAVPAPKPVAATPAEPPAAA